MRRKDIKIVIVSSLEDKLINKNYKNYKSVNNKINFTTFK